MSIIEHLVAARRGRPVRIAEPGSKPGKIRGHIPGTGLRGHSVDDETYPWRVVGVGSAWEVHDSRGDCWYRNTDIYKVHAKARCLKVLHPAGCPKESPTGRPYAISASWEDFTTRAAGHHFFVMRLWNGATDARRYYLFPEQRLGNVLKVFDDSDGGVKTLSFNMLATDPVFYVEMDWREFANGKKPEIEP